MIEHSFGVEQIRFFFFFFFYIYPLRYLEALSVVGVGGVEEEVGLMFFCNHTQQALWVMWSQHGRALVKTIPVVCEGGGLLFFVAFFSYFVLFLLLYDVIKLPVTFCVAAEKK